MATTHWDSAQLEYPGEKSRREAEFRTDVWKDILEDGATLEQVKDYKKDPERIINDILWKTQERELEYMGLQIQEELVDKRKRLPDTEAGKKLRYTLEEYVQQSNESEVETDPEKRRQKMASIQEQLDALKVPFLQRLKGAFQFKRGSSSKT